MSTRTLLLSVTLIAGSLFSPSVVRANQALDLRHQEGVEVLELQRDGFGAIMGKLWKLTRLAELSALPTTTNTERYQLDARFHGLVYEIGQIAISNVHGWSPLNAQLHIRVQVAPGSSQSTIVAGLDVRPYGLAIDQLYVYQSFLAQSALPALESARAYVRTGTQRNCADLGSLGIDANCGATLPFCRGGVNSTGWSGRLYGTGSLVAGQPDQLQLSMYNCPSGSLGWFIMGRSSGSLPFGSGELCIHPGGLGLIRISQSTMVSPHGTLDLSLADVSPQITSLIQPGSTWYFQFLFDDIATASVNTTNALQVTFEP